MSNALTADEEILQGLSEQYTLDMHDSLTSIRSLAGLDINRTLCHHGGFVAEGTDRIAEFAD